LKRLEEKMFPPGFWDKPVKSEREKLQDAITSSENMLKIAPKSQQKKIIGRIEEWKAKLATL